ncbi:MAG: hypothetical protein POH28_09860 [Acidocella sp.]|nr:hypothetical protein [Acidocella sp.]
MAYKVNYGLERAERNRAKLAKKAAKAEAKKAGQAEPPDDGNPLAEPGVPETDETGEDSN